MKFTVDIYLNDANNLYDLYRDINYIYQYYDNNCRLNDEFRKTTVCQHLKKASLSKKYQLGFIPYDIPLCDSCISVERILSSLIEFASNEVGLYVEELQEEEI